jgi:Fe-S-cluster-containing dehydrogenase component
MKHAFVIDLDRCIGCMSCEIACKMENKVSLGTYRCKVHTIGPNGEYPDVELYFLPLMCQQCEDPPCLRVCPTGATYKRSEDGAVLIDQDICIGCGSCEKACPYGALSLNKEKRVMDKCMQCQHLLKKGQKPACVKNCPGKAICFGDVDDPNEEVSKLLTKTEKEDIYMLADIGARPAVRYILRRDKWIGYPLDD